MATSTGATWQALLTRLHFYIGLFVGPFILAAALSGTLYVLSPQIEHFVYQDVLTTLPSGTEQPLAAQIQAAQAHLTTPLPLVAVRPAPHPGDTTRVLFQDPEASLSGVRAVFVAPDTLDITGDLPVYGTSGVLPLGMTLDFLHRQLLLGEMGRYYSELAASWLWVAALGGLYLWSQRRRTTATGPTNRRTLRRWHVRLGWALALGLVFFSATGLTWSRWAGENIGKVRASIGWVTPSVSTALPHHEHHGAGNGPAPESESAGPAAATFDEVLSAARTAGLDAAKLEILPAAEPGRAWTVREIDRAWPTQVDAVAIDPASLTVVSRADFAEYPLIANLIRWGIDAHMGVLFGWPNQLLLAAFGVGLCALIVLGYRLWWRRRPMAGPTLQPLLGAWLALSPARRCASGLVAIALGISLPVMGVSLLVFLMIDGIRWARQRQAVNRPDSPSPAC
ncbi:PepSY-associated TM helix domain-containing protein [Marinobacter sp. C2H3]|uniref:PepSY-associated TM helix domain-containing protein n=1 Tax=Marinobacter sp. C2H3 TaxID=3119003 RepID=UPI00300E7BE7